MYDNEEKFYMTILLTLFGILYVSAHVWSLSMRGHEKSNEIINHVTLEKKCTDFKNWIAKEPDLDVKPSAVKICEAIHGQ